ncbi:hypothetical protein PK98_05405 [Croceibacterium mercuriale]|uniref:Uncharacterized protein n=1 Tax=Croceibacterium mercuriale TaxID=1572751 RepID=A0A0B2BX27_9SPHN|nr:hypothetical protein [Croceibacterium mercuriale]KHL25994.1 hypothetical protein PK98_05405 [Croceibacterium mercuriale]
MTAIDLKLAEDRALRDAAKRLLDADIAFIREDLGQRSAGGRVADRAADAALDIADDALNFAREHRTAFVAVAAVIVAWFARRPICKGLSQLRDTVEDTFR